MPRGGARPRAGAPPKPIELKKRLGNPGKRPLPNPVTAIQAVGPAAALPRFGSGTEMLQHVLDAGASSWIGPTDITAVMARDLYDDWLLARRAWQESGSEKDFRAYDAITKSLNLCLSSLGLNPADRGRLGLAQVKARSALEELRERRARGQVGRLGG